MTSTGLTYLQTDHIPIRDHLGLASEYSQVWYQIKGLDETYNNITIDWLVVLRLNVPVNNFSVMSGRSHRFLGN